MMEEASWLHYKALQVQGSVCVQLFFINGSLATVVVHYILNEAYQTLLSSHTPTKKVVWLRETTIGSGYPNLVGSETDSDCHVNQT